MVAVQGNSEILRLLVADQADVEQRLPNENATHHFSTLLQGVASVPTVLMLPCPQGLFA